MTIAEVKKHKTTIKFVEENWLKLQNLAAIQNTSPTAILNSLLDAFVNENLPENYEKRIQDRVYSELDKRIDDVMIDEIALRVAIKLGLKKDEVLTEADPIEAFVISEKPEKKQIFYADDTASTTKDTDISSTTSTTKKKKLSQEEKIAANLAHFQQYKASSNKKSYADSYVSAQEGLSRETVRRYRNGSRSAKPEFVERWGLNWNQTQWIKN